VYYKEAKVFFMYFIGLCANLLDKSTCWRPVYVGT
jgi:hypothetical protein